MALREDIEQQGAWLFRWRSYLPLLITPLLFIALKHSEVIERFLGDNIDDLWESFAVIVSLIGLGIRCFTVGSVPRGTSGRNTRSQVAEVLNTTGMYSVVRNPLYLGNFIIVFGVTLFIQVWWLALVVWISFWLYYERIIFAEEEFLRDKFGQRFINWAEKTPMIIPNFKNWHNPELSFSFKTVLRREFSTYFAIVSSYFFIEIAEEFLTEKRFFIHSSWIVFFVFSLLVYLVFLTLKKKTHILDIQGR